MKQLFSLFLLVAPTFYPIMLTASDWALIKDVHATQVVSAIFDYSAVEDWGKVANLIDGILQKDDCLVEDKKKRLVSSHLLADQILCSLPPEGRDAYETLVGGAAEKARVDAIKKSDLRKLEAIYKRYKRTRAGGKAGLVISSYYLDRGRADAAAFISDDLTARSDLSDAEQTRALLYASLAASAQGDMKKRDKLFTALKDGLQKNKLALADDSQISPEEITQVPQWGNAGISRTISEEFVWHWLDLHLNPLPRGVDREKIADAFIKKIGYRNLLTLMKQLKRSDSDDLARLNKLQYLFDQPKPATAIEPPRSCFAVEDPFVDFALSPDGKKLTFFVPSKQKVVTLDAETGKQISETKFVGHVRQFLFSPKEGVAFAEVVESTDNDLDASLKTRVALWDLNSGNVEKTFSSFPATSSLLFSKAGDKLYAQTIATDGHIEIFDTKTGSQISQIRNPALNLGKLSGVSSGISREGIRLLFVAPGYVWVMDGAGNQILQIDREEQPLAIHPNGPKFAYMRAGQPYLFDGENENALLPSPAIGLFRPQAISPDGNLVVVDDDQGGLFMYEKANFAVKLNSSFLASDLSLLRFSPGGDALVAQDAKGKVCVWNFGRRNENNLLLSPHRLASDAESVDPQSAHSTLK